MLVKYSDRLKNKRFKLHNFYTKECHKVVYLRIIGDFIYSKKIFEFVCTEDLPDILQLTSKDVTIYIKHLKYWVFFYIKHSWIRNIYSI